MTNLEKANIQESTLENEVNQALSKFSAEKNQLKSSVIENNKDLRSRTKEEMKDYVESGECKKRIEEYIKINGEKINVSKLEMDNANGLIKMEYKITIDGTEKEITTYMKIMGEANNTYIQFQKNPTLQKDITSAEIYTKNNNKIFAPEDGYKEGKMYDINIVKSASKWIDIRIVENLRKTQEKIEQSIKNFELTPEFKDTDFDDASLENTEITAFKDTKLGKEITKEDTGYSRAIFIKEGEKYREVAKVYFTKTGAFDKERTANTQEIKILNIPLTIEINKEKTSFAIKNIDALKEQIKTQRQILSSYIENSEFGDNTIFSGFNRANGGKRQQTKLLGLHLTEDMYTFKRRGDKGKETLNFAFNQNNELILKDIAGKQTEPVTIEIERANGRKEIREIIKDSSKKQLRIQPTTKELTHNQEKPELQDEPTLLNKDYLYNRNNDGKKLEYHNKNGTLLSSIPASKTDKNEWKLGTLSENVQADQLYKYTKDKMMDKTVPERLRELNLLDQDLANAFGGLIKKQNISLDARPVVKVLDDEKKGIYKYYKVQQNDNGEPFAFEEDKELYEAANKCMNILLENIATLEKIENTKLMFRDKKEKVDKKFTQFVGGSGFLPIETDKKIAFLQETEKIKTPLTKTFIRGSKTDDIQKFDITFAIKGNDISTKEKQQTINKQTYKTRLKQKDESLTLRFDDIE